MRASPQLRVERMEDRHTPAMFGTPWLSPNVTVSFAPDGTLVDGVKSDLAAHMAADGLTAAQWQGEVQRALQAWAAASNLNFGLVADGGQPVGTGGRLQADTRFGDIRVTARPLADNVLAITTPPGSTAETRAGDIVLNSNYHFDINPAEDSGRYDLYTVLLQEIGHAVGVGNCGDCDSVMYEAYDGVRSGLGDMDRAAVRALYGGRANDALEGNGNNGTSKATALPTGTGTRYLRADLTVVGDKDVYSFTTPATLTQPLTVRVRTAGLSLLAAKLELLDANGAVLTGTSGIPTAGADLELSLTTLKANTKYFVRVSAPSGTAFRTGGYDLRVIFDPAASDPGAAVAPAVVSDAAANETVGAATALTALPGTTAQAFYRTYGRIDSSADVDVYRVKAPALPAGETTTLFVQVASYSPTANTGGQAALARVYDAAGNLIAVEDLTYSGVRKAYQLRNVPGGAEYYIAVGQNGLLSDKSYELTAYFHPTAVNYAVTDTVTVAPNQDTTFRTLTVNQAQVFTISVESKSVGSGAPTLVFLDVIDATGKTVYTILGYPGMNYGSAVMLAPGEYTVRLRAPFSSSTAAPLQMTLRLDALTDPIGLDAPTDTTTSGSGNRIAPDPTVPPFTWTTLANSYYAWLM